MFVYSIISNTYKYENTSKVVEKIGQTKDITRRKFDYLTYTTWPVGYKWFIEIHNLGDFKDLLQAEATIFRYPFFSSRKYYHDAGEEFFAFAPYECSLQHACNILEKHGAEITRHTEDTYKERPARSLSEPLELPYEYEEKVETSLNLRPYQLQALEAMRSNEKGILVLPTGTGKTAIFLSYIKENPGRYAILVPSIQLRKQTATMCKRLGIPCVRFDKNVSNYEDRTVIIGTYQGCKNMQKLALDGIIFDECHNTVVLNKDEEGEEYTAFQKLLNHPCEKKYFFTATVKNISFRDSNETCVSMDNTALYGETIYAYNLGDAIENGYLMDYRTTIIYTEDRVSSMADYIKEGRARKTVIFCAKLSTVTAVYKRLESALKDVCLFSLSEDDDTEEILEEFKEHQGVSVLVACKKAKEGYDEPTVDTVIHYDITSSSIELIQKNGRALRIHPDKTMANIVFMCKKEETDAERIRQLSNSISYMKQVDSRLGVRIEKAKTQRRHTEKLFDVVVSVDYTKEVYDMFWNKVSGESFRYADAKEVILKQNPRITTKEAYYELCKKDDRLSLDPREYFGQNFDWCDYIGLNRADYYTKEECAKKSKRYVFSAKISDKTYMISLCKTISSQDSLFPPYDMWCEVYQEPCLKNILFTRRVFYGR